MRMMAMLFCLFVSLMSHLGHVRMLINASSSSTITDSFKWSFHYLWIPFFKSLIVLCFLQQDCAKPRNVTLTLVSVTMLWQQQRRLFTSLFVKSTRSKIMFLADGTLQTGLSLSLWELRFPNCLQDDPKFPPAQTQVPFVSLCALQELNTTLSMSHLIRITFSLLSSVDGTWCMCMDRHENPFCSDE